MAKISTPSPDEIRAKIDDKRKARKEATHLAILHAAEFIVISEGRKALTTKRLVQEAGVSERTIFNHFANIDDVLLSALGRRLSALIKVEDFPVHFTEEEIPQVCEKFILDSIQADNADGALARFIELAAVYQDADDLGEAIGNEVFQTLMEVSWDIATEVERHCPNLSNDLRFNMALYLHNCMTSLAYGMGYFFFEHKEEIESNGFDIGVEHRMQIRRSMVWAVQKVSAGKPKF